MRGAGDVVKVPEIYTSWQRQAGMWVATVKVEDDPDARVHFAFSEETPGLLVIPHRLPGRNYPSDRLVLCSIIDGELCRWCERWDERTSAA
jgi:hypothetical protein